MKYDFELSKGYSTYLGYYMEIGKFYPSYDAIYDKQGILEAT